MSDAPTRIADVAAAVDIPDDGIVSRVLFKDAAVRVVVFGFDTGQELTEHTATRPAILEVISGRVRLGLGEVVEEMGPGGWVHMPAGLPHSVLAREPTVLLLTLLGSAT